MSREYKDIAKQIDQSHQNLYNDSTIEYFLKDQAKILQDISDIKKDIKDINYKIDIMLEILNNFTIMLAEEDEDEDEYSFGNDDYVVPEQEEEWNTYDDEDESEY